MLTNQEPEPNIEDLTDAEIYAAIRYLEPDSRSANERNNDIATTKQNDDKAVLICVSLYMVLIGCIALWLYWR